MNQRRIVYFLRSIIGLCLLMLSLSQTGCALYQETGRVFDLAKRTVSREPNFYNYLGNDRIAQREARLLAEQAWIGVLATVQNPSPEYENGFTEGFADYLYRGGTGKAPLVPPRGFWKLRFQNPNGELKVKEWYAGFEHGVRDCQQRGIRDMWTVPTSFVPDQRPVSLESMTSMGMDVESQWMPQEQIPLAPAVVPRKKKTDSEDSSDDEAEADEDERDDESATDDEEEGERRRRFDFENDDEEPADSPDLKFSEDGPEDLPTPDRTAPSTDLFDQPDAGSDSSGDDLFTIPDLTNPAANAAPADPLPSLDQPAGQTREAATGMPETVDPQPAGDGDAGDIFNSLFPETNPFEDSQTQPRSRVIDRERPVFEKLTYTSAGRTSRRTGPLPNRLRGEHVAAASGPEQVAKRTPKRQPPMKLVAGPRDVPFRTASTNRRLNNRAIAGHALSASQRRTTETISDDAPPLPLKLKRRTANDFVPDIQQPDSASTNSSSTSTELGSSVMKLQLTPPQQLQVREPNKVRGLTADPTTWQSPPGLGANDIRSATGFSTTEIPLRLSGRQKEMPRIITDPRSGEPIPTRNLDSINWVPDSRPDEVHDWGEGWSGDQPTNLGWRDENDGI